MNIGSIAIDRNYAGKGLLYKGIKSTEDLAKLKGYTYVYCFATNFRSAKGLQKAGFDKLG